MVSYYITAPRKNGDHWVVDVKEYYGGSTTRASTIRLDQALPFIKAVFHGEIHNDYKKYWRDNDVFQKKNIP